MVQQLKNRIAGFRVFKYTVLVVTVGISLYVSVFAVVGAGADDYEKALKKSEDTLAKLRKRSSALETELLHLRALDQQRTLEEQRKASSWFSW